MSHYVGSSVFGASAITRKTRRSHGLLGFAAAAPILMLTPTVSVFAQEAAPSGAAAGAGTASKEQTGATSGGPEEIVVTATRRSEKLQAVPIAVTSLSGEQLAASGINQTLDLTLHVTGLRIDQKGGAMQPYIRGVGTDSIIIGGQSDVAIYVDGVYQASPWAANFSFNSIVRTEVDKGPQGTLFGRNATGGLIQVTTRSPSPTPTADVSLSYGSYNTTETKVYVADGVAENLAADLAIYYSNQGSAYGHDVFLGAPRTLDYDISVRSKWVYTPSDDTIVTAIFDRRNTNSDVGFNFRLAPGYKAPGGIVAPANYQDVDQGVVPFDKLTTTGVSVRLEQQLGDDLIFINTAAFRNSQTQFFDESDGAAETHLLTTVMDQQNINTWTEEAELQSTSDSAFKWTVGGFYMHDEEGYSGPQGFTLTGDYLGGIGLRSINDYTVDSVAAYGEGSYEFDTGTKITIGGRYTADSINFGLNPYVLDATGTSVLQAVPHGARNKTYESPTWRFIIDQKLTDDNLIYFSYSRGFKAGGFNPTSLTDPPFAPEKLDAYEIGSKNQFLDRRLVLNLAAFHYDFSNEQLFSNLNGAPTIQNAASSTEDGAELEGTYYVTDGLTLDGGLSYLRANFSGYPNAQCGSPVKGGGFRTLFCDLAGYETREAPKFTANLGITYAVPLGSGTLTSNVLVYYNAGFYWSDDHQVRQPAYAVVNGTIMWKNEKGFGFGVYARNLFDQNYPVYGGENPVPVVAPAPPRELGVTLTYSF